MEGYDHNPYEPGVSPATETQDMLYSKDAKLWAMILHLSQLAHLAVPGIGGIIVPIIIWQIKKDEYPEIDEHGRIVTNWILSWLIYTMISGLLVLVLIGIPLLIVLSILAIVFPIIGGLKANQGELWKYPLSISFL